MNLAAVIITYNPDESLLSENVGHLVAAGITVCVVDNSPMALTGAYLSKPDVHYLYLNGNVGIARAQNEGIRFFRQRNAQQILLLDQDSRLSPLFIGQLIQCAAQIASERDVAAIGPSIFCGFEQKVHENRVDVTKKWSDSVISVRQIIASGMIINVRCLDDVGLKDESLFIDGVDHEWCWRAIHKGYLILRDTSLQLPHRQGEGRLNIMGLTFKKGVPVRLYYQFRNILLLSTRSYVPLYWKCRNLGAMPLRFIVNAVLMQDRKARIRYMLTGLVHGLRRKSGKVNF